MIFGLVSDSSLNPACRNQHNKKTCLGLPPSNHVTPDSSICWARQNIGCVCFSVGEASSFYTIWDDTKNKWSKKNTQTGEPVLQIQASVCSREHLHPYLRRGSSPPLYLQETAGTKGTVSTMNTQFVTF